ncbi:hypothetical protein FBU30_001308 [Linnemannia zychae]|nr:hypothetical protein FBU30_001308 [Linnemannia zychae]
MSSTSSPLLQPTATNAAKNAHETTDSLPYPSPSHSPTTTYQTNMDSHRQPSSPSAIFNRRRFSVKALLKSTNPPASPLDALVMALEATVEEEEGQEENNEADQEAYMEEVVPVEDEEDPDATIPSSPTVFMKRPTADSSSLHHLPTMFLPESVISSSSVQGVSNAKVTSLTPSTHPSSSSTGQQSTNIHANRKMSVSSQGSTSSTQSNSHGIERTKEYGCTIGNCEKKFYQVAHLRSHERHLDVLDALLTVMKKMICRFDGCDRAFTQLGNLKTHERKHTGERPYKCPHPDCDKTFTQLGNLKTHERIHDEVKPFMCRLPGCGKTFSQLGNLKTHTAKMHPDMTISDDELSIRTMPTTAGVESQYRFQHHHQQQQYNNMSRTINKSDGSARLIPSKEPGVVQVIAHFNPYQRRPIQPQQSEEERLLRKIRAMIHHQQQVRELEDGSEVSDEMEE